MCTSRSILILLISFICFQSNSQEKKLIIDATRNDNNSISLTFEKYVYGTYYVSLWFNRLENATGNRLNRSVSGRSGNFATLRPLNESQPILYSYQYWYIRGKLKPKYDPDFVYLLPIGVNKTNEVVEMSNVDEKYFGAKAPKNWKSYLFHTDIGDTVYASRKGKIVNIEGDKDYNRKATTSYQSSINRIMIEHRDGTLATYGGLNKNDIFVQEGDIVFPGDALGKIAQYDERQKGQLRFSLYYLDHIEPGKEKPKALKDKIQYYAYITPLFLTKDGAIRLKNRTKYQGISNQQVVEMELSKRELKKRSKKMKSH